MTSTYKALKIASCFITSVVLFGGSAFAGSKSQAYQDARVLMDKDDFKPAIAKIIDAQKGGEDTIDLSLLLTEAYAGRINQVGNLKKMKLAKKIKKSSEHSLQLDPDNVEALDGLIQFHMQAPGIAGGDKKQAHTLLTKLIALKPIRGHMLSAQLLAEEDKMAEAKVHLDKAIAIDPKNTDVLMGKAAMEIEQEQYAQAIATYETCLAIEADNWECRYQLGKTSQTGKVEYEKGKAAFLAFIENGHENKNYIAYAHYRLGNIFNQTGDAMSAKKHYEFAVKIDNLKPAKKALAAMK